MNSDMGGEDEGSVVCDTEDGLICSGAAMIVLI